MPSTAQAPATPSEPASHLTYYLTKAEIAATFAEWQRRVRENPGAFMSDEELAAMSIGERGATDADCFLRIAGDLALVSVE